jgi:outer membrane lipoprotein carrier protein
LDVLHKGMKRVTVVGLCCWLLLAAPGGARALLTAEEVVQGIQKRYETISDLQADFHQRTKLPMMNRVKEAGGEVFLKMPGKMRWDYLEGQKKVVIINGSTLWFYDPEERQLTISDLSHVAGAQRLLSFLTGMGDLTKEFDVSASQGVEETPGGDLTIHLVPRFENAQWKNLRLTVDPHTFQVVGTGFEGLQGDETDIVYSNIRTNVGLADALFEFKVPAGTEILHYPPREQPQQ